MYGTIECMEQSLEIKNKNGITLYPLVHKKKRVKEYPLCSDGIGLGRKDSNLRVTGPKPGALPLGHAPF